MKLSSKFLLLMSAGVVISVISVSFLAFFFTKSSLQKEIEEQQLASTQQTMDKIDRYMEERYKDIETVSTDNVIKNILVQHLNQKISVPEKDTTDLKKRMEELSISTGPWERLTLLDTHAITFFSTDSNGENQKNHFGTSAMQMYNEANAGNVIYSDVFYDSSLKRNTMLFAAPVINDDGPMKVTVGVAMGNLSWPAVLELLQDVRSPFVNLYTKDGYGIGDGNLDHIEQFLTKQSQRNLEIPEAMQGKEGSKVIDSKALGSATLASYAQEKGVLNYKGNHWKLVIQTPTGQAFGPAVSASITITLFLIPIIVIVNSIVLFFILRLLEPINLLTRATRELAEGDLSKRVPIHSSDEVGQLAEAYNEMASKLQELYSSMEQKVQERTNELVDAKDKLQQQLTEIKNTNNLMVDRELKMIELKKEIDELKQKKLQN